MHLEVLVEDLSGRRALEHILPKILDPSVHSWRVIEYKGIGHIPKGLNPSSSPRHRILLDQLPRLLKGYGKSLKSYGGDAAVVVVVDADRANCTTLKAAMMAVLGRCRPPPQTKFRIAVEEMEAWYLGDLDAIAAAYPRHNRTALRNYEQDSVCGTWEVLAEAVHEGGAAALTRQGYPLVGIAKSEWATRIGPAMNPARNRSPSFRTFAHGLRDLAGEPRLAFD